MKREQVTELLYQALETEQGGVKVYQTALRCAVNDELKMELALGAGQPEAAQLVAAECVVEAETKDHQNWELIGLLADKLTGREAKALKAAHAEVEDQEDEHLYHTMG
jgi:hypothetical protein